MKTISQRLTILETIAKQNSEQISQLFRMESKQNGEYIKMIEDKDNLIKSLGEQITNLHTEMTASHTQVMKRTEEIVELYETSSRVLKGVYLISKWFLPVMGAGALIFKYLKH